MDNNIKSSSCSKVILLGEHSILDGGSAIALPIPSKSLSLEIFEKPQSNKLSITGTPLSSNEIEITHSKFWGLVEKEFPEFKDFSFHIHTDIPLGAGLGSSAALCVALLRASLIKRNAKISEKEFLNKAYQSENYFHGKSSGLDPTTTSLEKVIYFKNIDNFRVLNLPQFLEEYVFVAFDTNVRRSTLGSVNKVNKLKSENLNLWKSIVQELQQNAEKGAVAFESNKVSDLAKCMNYAQEKLTQLGVSHPAIEEIISFCKNNGALATKLSGAGLGGFCLSLFNSKDWELLRASLVSGNHSHFSSRFFEIKLL